ncbi:MAG: putative bifunctional diguanylate cyclase/phosphodiesterase, partial [Pseudomonadota bacterium]
WKNLLLRTLMRNGAESAAYQTYLNVVDLLSARLTAREPYSAAAKMTDEELIEWASRMLAMVSSNEQKNHLLLREMARDLTGQSATPVETKYVPALISKGGLPAHDGGAQRPDEVAEDVWQLMLEDAKQLTLNEPFLYRDGQGREHRLSLVWRDDDRRFVFADNLGLKALDRGLGEVANDLYQKSLARIGEKELSLTERATYSFLQSLHRQIAYQASHDDLTGLLNRKAFEQALAQALKGAKVEQSTHVLGYFDLDRFNIINSTCGHSEGDRLLRNVAEVLQETVPETATLARLGGDEFGIILHHSSRIHGLKLLTAIHESVRAIRFSCENNEFKVTCSMGVTEINENSDSPGRLLGAVDSATFTAKDNGRDNIQIHNVENQRITSRRHILDWVGRINVLFEKELIRLRCQKIAPVHTTVNSLPNYEVLLDVHDEAGNKVPLNEFIVAAERYNRIIDIDTWVVNQILDWLELHREKLSRIGNLSVNLSSSSLGNRQFIDQLYQRLSRPNFPADKICFELTETIAMSHLDTTARFMKRLKESGCHFSLDDFGSGTSSYAYLRSLPIDYLKIDGAFIKDIASNTGDYAVVKSINEIGHALGKLTVAEMVEDEFAYQMVYGIGIDYVQGFGVEKPIPLEKLFG